MVAIVPYLSSVHRISSSHIISTPLTLIGAKKGSEGNGWKVALGFPLLEIVGEKS
jgi:hypothetical protein